MSYGQELCKEHLANIIFDKPYENYRPDWLFGMELDFYYPDLGFAVEFNGDQHYYATSLSPDPRAQMMRDRRKKAICKERGIDIVIITAINLCTESMRRKFKKRCRLKPYHHCYDLAAKCIAYRKNLIANYNSPTCHRKKGAPRKKTLAKLTEKYPPHYTVTKQA